MEERSAGGNARGRVWRLLLLVVPAVFATAWIWIAVAGAGSAQASAVLYDLKGHRVGRAVLAQGPANSTRIRYYVHGLPAGFHAFHVHVNGVCDAHHGFDTVGDHYDHLRREQPFDGDLPVILVGSNGTGSGSFVTDRFQVDNVEGMALVVHAFADNYANVPIGNSKDEYWPNGPRAVDITSGTGNAGEPIACGVIQKVR